MNPHAYAPAGRQPGSILKQAVYHHRALSRQGLLERAFAAMFDGLVYPQIWEDPVVDMQALCIRPGDHVVAIASGGCNVMSYLTGDPARITAVDLNEAHLALVRLKVVAAMHLPGHEAFRQFFADTGNPANVALYDDHLAARLDPQSRDHWSAGAFGRRRISMFGRNIYRRGVLGRFILIGHAVARLHGVNPAAMMNEENLAGQRRFFEEKLAPLFDRKLLRWAMSSPVSLYGLGIPPAQYAELAEGRHMADVVRERLGRLACDFTLNDNYFARQAFGRSYGDAETGGSLPPYLEAENWDMVRTRAGRIRSEQGSVTDVLGAMRARSVNKVVLLDAQDWMDDRQLNDLWRALASAAAPGARVIFRTAASRSPLEGRVDPAILGLWSRDDETSAKCHVQDRSGIYGGFHLYVRDA